MSEVDARQPVPTTGNFLRVPADVNQLASVRAFVRQQAELLGADPRAIPDIVQAVDESVTNAIVHGYGRHAGEVGGKVKGEVELEVDRAGRSLVVRLRDRAPAFDPTIVPAPDTSRPLLGGMGVQLTRELTDEVRYRRTKGGNELTLVKVCIEEEGEDA